MSDRTSQKLTISSENDTRARFERWKCIGCGHDWQLDRVPKYCRACGMLGGYAPYILEIKGSRSNEIGQLLPGVRVAEWASVLPTGLPLGCSALLRGRPGGGKSRAAFRFASQIGETMVFALEMGKRLSCVTAESAGALLVQMWWYDTIAGIEEIEAIDPAVVVVDSVQKLGKERGRVVTKLRRWAVERDRNLVLVSQLGQHGASRHGEDDDFDCDMVCDVSSRKTDAGPRMFRHGHEDKATQCRDNCAHIVVVKSRVCELVGFDVPIIE